MNKLAAKAGVDPASLKYLWADAIANELYAIHHEKKKSATGLTYMRLLHLPRIDGQRFRSLNNLQHHLHTLAPNHI